MRIFKKWQDPNPSLNNEFDYLNEYGFTKSYISINGEEEIIFRKSDNCIEIYHNFSRRKVIVEVVVSFGEGRINLGELIFGVKKVFYSLDETKNQILSYLNKYVN